MPPAPTPVIVTINSNAADGRDPSWLWDVPFEQAARPHGGGHRRPPPGPGRAPAARRSRPRRHRGPVRTRSATAGRHARPRRSSTARPPTPPSTTCAPLRSSNEHHPGLHLPQPAGHVRRRRQRPGAAAPCPTARHRRRGAAGRTGTAGSGVRATSTCSAAARTARRRPRPTPCAPTGALDAGGRARCCGAGHLRRLPVARRVLPRRHQHRRPPGSGILDIRTDRLPKRAVGELAATAEATTGPDPHRLREPRRRHPSRTRRRTAGRGPRGDRQRRRHRGRRSSGHIIGTYLHGPCLARNPQIADVLLGWATGQQLPFIEEPEVTHLREERLRTVLG